MLQKNEMNVSISIFILIRESKLTFFDQLFFVNIDIWYGIFIKKSCLFIHNDGKLYKGIFTKKRYFLIFTEFQNFHHL